MDNILNILMDIEFFIMKWFFCSISLYFIFVVFIIWPMSENLKARLFFEVKDMFCGIYFKNFKSEWYIVLFPMIGMHVKRRM